MFKLSRSSRTSIRHSVTQAQAGYFHDIRPAATMVEVNGLLVPEMLVEIEADAVSTER